jgi:hypothetical protein
MKSSRLFLVTLMTVLVSAFAMTGAGWFRPRAARAAAVRPHSSFPSEAALRYRHCQASHWRACLLQH